MTAVKPDVAAWLRDRTPKHLELLDSMRDRLAESLQALPPRVTPSRDWARVYEAYQAGYHALIADVRETAKMALMAQVRGTAQPLTDDEFEREMGQLVREQLRELPADELAAELARRGVSLPAPRKPDE